MSILAQMQAEMPSELVSSAEAESSSSANVNAKQPIPKLANHDVVGYALMASSMSNLEEWNIPGKTKDQFDHADYKSALKQRSLERSSEKSEQVSSGSLKRSLRNSAGGPPTKRSRGAGSQLASVDEDVPAE